MATNQTRTTNKSRTSSRKNNIGGKAASSAVSVAAPLKITAAARKFGFEFVGGKYMWNDVPVRTADISNLIPFLNELQGVLPTRRAVAH